MTTAHSKMTLKIKGASDIQPSKDPYNYDNWIVEVSFADNSSRYHVAFYSEEGTLISESDVHSYQEACALTLPENRAYAMVSKYSSEGELVGKEIILKEKTYPFLFANEAGVFWLDTSYVAL